MRRSVPITGVVVLFACVATVILALTEGGPAQALGTTHQLIDVSNHSADIENAVSLSFTCSPAAKSFTLQMTNINLVDRNGASFASGGDLKIDVAPTFLLFPGPPYQVYLSMASARMTQNRVNGLWQVHASGRLLRGTSSSCASGADLFVVDDEVNAGTTPMVPSLDFEGRLS
jgi:hypothetical protein